MVVGEVCTFKNEAPDRHTVKAISLACDVTTVGFGGSVGNGRLSSGAKVTVDSSFTEKLFFPCRPVVVAAGPAEAGVISTDFVLYILMFLSPDEVDSTQNYSAPIQY